MYNGQNKGRWKRGHSAVEFSLALPFFIILVIGIIEFGWYFFVQHTLQYATREGMRLALVGRTIPGSSSRADSIIRTIRQQAAPAVNPGALIISIFPVKADFSDPDNWQAIQNPGQPGDYMRVRTQYDHKMFTPLIGSLIGDGHIMIKAEGTYRNESFD